MDLYGLYTTITDHWRRCSSLPKRLQTTETKKGDYSHHVRLNVRNNS